MGNLIEKFKELSLVMKLIVIAGILFVGSAIIAGIIEDGEEPKEIAEVEADEPKEETEEPDEEELTDEEQGKVEEPEETLTVELDAEFMFGEYTVNEFKTEIKDNELKLMFYWINQSGKDDIPFTSVGYFDVLQGDEILRDTSGAFDAGTNSDALRRVDRGIMAPVTLTYELESDEPVEVSFGATHEIDDTKETLIIEID